MERFKMIASAYGIFLRDETVLLLRRFQTGYADGQYSLPAGHVEENESLLHNLAREIHEEVAVTITEESVKLVHVMHRKETDIRMDFFYSIAEWTGTPTNAEPHKCDELAWFPLSDLPDNTVPYIRQALELYQQGVLYSQHGWD